MDIHGLYTEVLIRWMERIEAGQPPLIFGDGMQTMDFVYVARHRPRPTCWPPRPTSPTTVFNIASGTETSLLELAAGAAAGDGLRPGPEYGPARRSTASPAGWPTPTRPPSAARLPAEIGLDEGLRRLVDGGGREPLAEGTPVPPA